MKNFACKICGEVYIGSEKPHTCPFCGVSSGFLRDASEWKDENDIEISEISRKNLLKALEVELSNTAFYKCAYETLSNTEVALMFKGLMKVEREHASVFRKILKPEKDPEVDVSCLDNPIDCIAESTEREKRAVDFYQKALSEATEPRLREVFGAIMATEKDHLELDAEMIKKIK